MDADDVLENWSDFESEGSDLSIDESEESEEESSGDEEVTGESCDSWREIPGL